MGASCSNRREKVDEAVIGAAERVPRLAGEDHVHGERRDGELDPHTHEPISTGTCTWEAMGADSQRAQWAGA